MSELIVVHRIDNITPLDRHIPLHMTALHWFETDAPDAKVAEQLEAFARQQAAVTTRATEEALFGPEHDVPVMRLERTQELLDMHFGLLALAKYLGARLDERWVGEGGWNPHVTHQSEERLQVGDTVEIDSLDLIVREDDGMRRLVTRVELGGRDD